MGDILTLFLKEQPNCELLGFSWQPLNVVTSLLFFFIAYKIYKSKNNDSLNKILSIALFLSGAGSLLHHLLPNDSTLLFDIIPLVIITIIGLIAIIKNYNPKNSFLYLSISLMLILALSAFFLDIPLCQMIPTGTHFLWHITMAYVILMLSTVTQ